MQFKKFNTRFFDGLMNELPDVCVLMYVAVANRQRRIGLLQKLLKYSHDIKQFSEIHRVKFLISRSLLMNVAFVYNLSSILIFPSFISKIQHT